MGRVTRSGHPQPSPHKRSTPVKAYKHQKEKGSKASTHSRLNLRKLPTKSEVLEFVLSRTGRSSYPRVSHNDALNELYRMLVGSVSSPGIWTRAECSPGTKPYLLSQWRRLYENYKVIKIKKKLNVQWRKVGTELFDIHTPAKDTEVFDADFLENQRTTKDQMISDNISSEFLEQEEEQEICEELAEAKKQRESGD